MLAWDKWDIRFMDLCKAISNWSSCYQEGRKIGAIIVKNKRILTTGYNGAPSGLLSCMERGECLRRNLNIPSGTRQELCYAIHAEQNAIIQAAKLGVSIDGATLYCTHQPCVICAKMIINAGIVRVVYAEGYPDDFSVELLNQAGVVLEHYIPRKGPNKRFKNDGNIQTGHTTKGGASRHVILLFASVNHYCARRRISPTPCSTFRTRRNLTSIPAK
jgi:dCMP deaminase